MQTSQSGRIGKSRYPLIEAMIAQGMTSIQIAETVGVFPETVRKFARRRNLAIVRNDADPSRHPSWRGGMTSDKHGYVLERVEIDGPFGYLVRQRRRGDPRGYALQHRIRMHQKLGRPLLPTEVVHHIDGNPRNNDPSNLELFATNGEHLGQTLKGQRPNWSASGFAAMCAPRGRRQRKSRSPSSTADHPKIDDLASP